VQRFCTTSVPSCCGCLQVSPTSPSKIGQWCAKPCCMTQPSGVCSNLSGPLMHMQQDVTVEGKTHSKVCA
jgi:hypothetical protein